MSSAVFISNVDDYLSPSQACVNPVYNGSNDAAANTKNEEGDAATAAAATAAAAAAVVVPRQRKRRPRAALNEQNGTGASTSATSTFEIPEPSKMDPIKASMADCLACSGCVTTAETVLLEQQHSLTALKSAMNESVGGKLLVATISPAVWADMLRHLKVPQLDAALWQRKLVTGLQQILGVTYVLDGNLPLQWSLLESAEEFSRAYQQKYGNNSDNNVVPASSAADSVNNVNSTIQQLDDKETPSLAINSLQAQYMLSDGSIKVTDKAVYPSTPALPLLTSACPALVCLVEKSSHGAARHLSRTKSPMSMAGAWLSQKLNPSNNNSKRIFHLGLMPCHDKKLEASRKDFGRSSSSVPGKVGDNDDDNINLEQDVDLVLTTQEWFQMMVEYRQNTASGQTIVSPEENWTKEEQLQNVRTYLDSLVPAPVLSGIGGLQEGINATVSATLLTAPAMASMFSNGEEIDMETDYQDDGNMNGTSNTKITNMDMNTDMEAVVVDKTPPSQNSSFFTLGSGGLAEFVFRYSARRLFDAQISDVIWKPVAAAANKTSSKRVVSARVQRRAAANNRDYHAVTLYRYTNASTGDVEYSCEEQPGGIPVLRFAIAYGLQTVQRVLEPFQGKTAGSNDGVAATDNYAFDFVEAMACPSGCLNGGGQVRVADRETPSQTRERVAQTRELFPALPPSSGMAESTLAAYQKELDTAVPRSERQTRYHVVPPLQHSMGAAAGVAVKDTQW